MQLHLHHSTYHKCVKRLFLNVNCTKILDIEYFSHIQDSHSDKLQLFFSVFHSLHLTWRWKQQQQQRKNEWESGKACFQLLKNHKRKYSLWDLRHMIISIKMSDVFFLCDAIQRLSKISLLATWKFDTRSDYKANTQWLKWWMENK